MYVESMVLKAAYLYKIPVVLSLLPVLLFVKTVLACLFFFMTIFQPTKPRLSIP